MKMKHKKTANHKIMPTQSSRIKKPKSELKTGSSIKSGRKIQNSSVMKMNHFKDKSNAIESSDEFDENEESYDENNNSENSQENSDTEKTEGNEDSEILDNSDGENSDLNEDNNSIDNGDYFDADEHKKGLKNLSKIDPEFYNYLQENDRKLLAFDDSGSDFDDEDEQEKKDEDVHKPPDSLEIASDESDFEEDTDNQSGSTTKISLHLVEQWENELYLKKKDSNSIISTVVKAFHAALLRVTGDEDTRHTGYKVDGSSVFNGVVQLCVTHLYPCLEKTLKLPTKSVTSKHVAASKQWVRLKSTLRSYLLDVIKLIGNVTSPDILAVLLKHLHQLLPLATCLPTVLKPLLKRLITLWSTNDDDTVRVIAFLCILHLSILHPESHHTILKMMYSNYVANSKFVSPTTLPGINFMRRSLSELFALKENISYNHAFLYIRQLAIHLRSAVMLKKKESMQSVYSWRFINSLRLWVDVLCATHDKTQMQTLIYPIVQIIIGCIKLIPTAQYLPLRYHCIQMLIQITKTVGTYIPILPFLLEVLTLLNVNNQHKKLSMKPMDLRCVLRLSKLQMQENAFKDAVIENLYQQLLEYTSCESHRISFPDLMVPGIIQLKHFLKECKNINYNRKLKTLVEKIDDTSKFINLERTKSGIALNDQPGIQHWESDMKIRGTPLTTFYLSWFKVHQQQQARKVTDTVKISEFNLPTIVRSSTTKKADEKMNKMKIADGKYELFPSDDEDSENEKSVNFRLEDVKTPEKIVERKKRKKETISKSGKKIKKNLTPSDKISDDASMEEDQDDIVDDLDISEFLS